MMEVFIGVKFAFDCFRFVFVISGAAYFLNGQTIAIIGSNSLPNLSECTLKKMLNFFLEKNLKLPVHIIFVFHI